MPTSYAFTGQRADSTTGLDYYGAPSYDPAAGRFTSADSVLPGGGYDPQGLDRYAYVEHNPQTHLDSDWHCFPFCTMLVGALLGALVEAATSVVSQAASGQGVNWSEVGKQAAVGAGADAISGLVEPEAGPLVHGAVDDVATAAGEVVNNALNHKPRLDRVLETGAAGAALSVGMGALMKVGGSLIKGVGRFIHRMADDAQAGGGALTGDGCGLSFSGDTRVAPPPGERNISSLKVGDQVLASDPHTKQATVQTVQPLFFHHDSDLVNGKLRAETAPAALDSAKPKPAAQGQHPGRAPAGGDRAPESAALPWWSGCSRG